MRSKNRVASSVSMSSARVLALCGVLSCLTARAEILCTAVAVAATGTVLKQEGACDRKITPASTFKIALSLMGYYSGYLTDERLPALPFHQGYADWVESWKASTDPTTWIRNSVVWYSQRLTEWLGNGRLRRYVIAFHYGNEDISGDPGKDNGLTHAWLSSSLKISALEQMTFLRKIVRRQLPVSAHAYDMTSRITAIALLPNGWDVHGKTGTGSPVRDDGSLDESHSFGWFVGWATNGNRTLVFARCVQDEKAESTNAGIRARAAFMYELPALLDALSK
jgi:beta-lactamase class D